MTAFPTDVNHKGEPELAKKSHEVAFICECFEKANHYSYSRDQRLKKVQTKIIEVNKNTP